MRRLLQLVAAAFAALPQLAAAATPQPCLTPAEFASLMEFALPGVVTGAAARCAQALPADAFLRRQGASLAFRYAEGRAQSWPQARSAFLKLSGGSADSNAIIAAMPDPSMQQMLLGVVEGMVTSQLPLEHCATADRLVRLLAPLPARNTAELVGALVELGTKNGGAGSAKPGSFNLCPR